MLYLGIDIGKNSHVATLIDENKTVLFKAFSFHNSVEGAESLIQKLPSSDVEIGLEATGHYWLSLYSFLISKNFSIHVINPIQTDAWRHGFEVRKRKTDVIYSLIIADLLRYGNFVETSLADENMRSLRDLSRFRVYLVSSIGDLKRKVIALLDQVFPEYTSTFSDIFGKTSSEILKQISAPKDFEEIMDKLNSPITSIPGIGMVTGATILGEIGDISRFSSASKLVAYAGIDASVSQSGEYEATINHMTKRGSAFLRKALFHSALKAEFSDPIFQAFYQKKIQEGKHHLVATNAVARKLVHTIYAILTKNVEYKIQS